MGKKEKKKSPAEEACDYSLRQILDNVSFKYPSMEEMRGRYNSYLQSPTDHKKLSPSEEELLYLLLGFDNKINDYHPGDVLTHQKIRTDYPTLFESCSKTVCTLNGKLRELMKETNPNYQYILNKRGVGYYCGPELCAYANVTLKMDYNSDSSTNDAPYSLPSYFIPPEKTYQKMHKEAFSERFIHVLFGRRGLGKTLLAEYYANQSCATRTKAESGFKTVIRTYYAENLENTIASLPCNIYSQPDSKTRYHDKLKMLNQCEKPALLIIDNYDSGLELLDSNPPIQEYKDLRDTGCKILITSRQKINGNLLPQTQIVPLPTEQLYKLFYQLADWTPYDSLKEEEERKQKTMELIEYLQNNTILTCIAAKLCQTKAPDELTAALQRLCITENQEPIYNITKDDTQLDDKTLLDICRTLFDFSEFKEDKNSRLFLANLALVPPEGMDYETFLTMAFSEELRPQMRKYRQNLEKQAWICYDSNSRIIFLHPLVREMVALELQDECKNTGTYLKALNKRFQVEFYHPGIDPQLKLALGAYAVYKKLNLTRKDSIFQDFTFLVTDIAGSYNILKQFSFGQNYGAEALGKLEDIKHDLTKNLQLQNVTLLGMMDAFDSVSQSSDKTLSPEEFEMLKHYARSLNILGFTFSQKGPRKNTEIAEKALLDSASLVFALLSQNIQDDSLRMLFSKNLGNLAGLYIQKKDYQHALYFHQKALSIREKVCSNSEAFVIRGSTSELKLHQRNMVSLANSYKGMATAYFYLARKENTCENLRKSIENHKEAYSIMKENLPAGSLDLVSEISRYSGAVTFYLDLKDCTLDDRSKAVLLESVCKHQIEAADILAELPQFTGDIKDCRDKLDKLEKCLDKLPDDLKSGLDLLNRLRDARDRLPKID